MTDNSFLTFELDAFLQLIQIFLARIVGYARFSRFLLWAAMIGLVLIVTMFGQVDFALVCDLNVTDSVLEAYV